jgi:urease accessory protein
MWARGSPGHQFQPFQREEAIMKSRLLTASVALTLAPGLAFAHTGIGDTSGVLHGFMHPVSGIDHILAMVMVGVFAWQLGGRALWLVPASFVTVMAIGGAFGAMGVGLPLTEIGIALSVVVLGLVVALQVQAPVAVGMGLVGMFAFFHGHAHGAEMPENAGGVAYAIGFMIATGTLHLCGIGMGYSVGKIAERYGSRVTRSFGGLTTMAGVALLAGVL